eukprot:CAMPEP_0197864576 /NCGR_PEP_ID=MMETSP1438-20131217/42907_1 /TAXON_ID=1461541 /ORGANISM="Pterosperma sp., Strain CCMP1384" /LENGTH=137 /DNA_ID=CAMNT_0043482867 /DNA_START=133 /DNA_END=547 /DNA_ORIENTATION=+
MRLRLMMLIMVLIVILAATPLSMAVLSGLDLIAPESIIRCLASALSFLIPLGASPAFKSTSIADIPDISKLPSRNWPRVSMSFPRGSILSPVLRGGKLCTSPAPPILSPFSITTGVNPAAIPPGIPSLFSPPLLYEL